MQPQYDFVEDIVRSVLVEAAGYDAGPSADAAPSRRDLYHAEVRFRGAWRGAVSMDIAADLARRLASAMTRIPQDDVDESVTRDAVGELANMIAGNLRPLLDGADATALPTVFRRRDVDIEGRPLPGRTLSLGGRSIEVRLLSDPADAGGR